MDGMDERIDTDMADNRTIDGARRRKVAVTRWPEGDTYFQLGNKDVGMKALRTSVLDDLEANTESMLRIDALDVYVKPSDGRAYYVAQGPSGQVSGSVAL